MKLMKLLRVIYIATAVFLLSSGSVVAHFGMVIPSDNMVMQDDERSVSLSLSFSHPFEGIGMPLEKPNRFFVSKDGKNIDLKDSLAPLKVMGHDAWQAKFDIRRPGAYLFVMEPVPFWEPAEDCFIVHYISPFHINILESYLLIYFYHYHLILYYLLLLHKYCLLYIAFFYLSELLNQFYCYLD